MDFKTEFERALAITDKRPETMAVVSPIALRAALPTNDFVRDLHSLCKYYRVQIVSPGYERLQVWDLVAGDEPVYGEVDDRRVSAMVRHE